LCIYKHSLKKKIFLTFPLARRGSFRYNRQDLCDSSLLEGIPFSTITRGLNQL
jgi:hypothetical protein